MSKKGPVPDAWDDDWESQADKVDVAAAVKAEEQVKITKAERLAKHAETNKKIWEKAYASSPSLFKKLEFNHFLRETPEVFHFVQARDNIPLKQEFKPALKILSRKPAPKVVERIDPLTGLAKLTIEEDEDEQKVPQPTAEEIRLRTIAERKEKQRLYDEAKARIMGTGSGSSTPGTATPPMESNRGKGRGRGQENRRPESQSQPIKELFDPNYAPKRIQKRGNGNEESSRSGQSTSRPEDQVIRAPRNPDPSGRGGFASRGRKMG